ncbi:MAG: acetate--CoA ligase family protein, partial [Methanobacteriota archaeon]
MNRRLLAEQEGYTLLDRYGITVPSYRYVTTHEEASAAAEEISFPVVVKVVSSQIVHKTDAGGVVLHISCKEALMEALLGIDERVHAYDPQAEISGYLIEKEEQSGVEFLIGGRTDPAFGKVLTVGMGGILVELLHDFSMRILPVKDSELKLMIQEMKGYQLITGYRGHRPLDEKALLETMQKATRLFLEEPDIVEFDINPLILWEEGTCAVDARIFVKTGPEDILPLVQVLPPVPDLLHPSSIAVVGASRTPGKVG